MLKLFPTDIYRKKHSLDTFIFMTKRVTLVVGFLTIFLVKHRWNRGLYVVL